MKALHTFEIIFLTAIASQRVFSQFAKHVENDARRREGQGVIPELGAPWWALLSFRITIPRNFQTGQTKFKLYFGPDFKKNGKNRIWRAGRWSIGSGPRFGTDSRWFQVRGSDGDPIQAHNDLGVRGQK